MTKERRLAVQMWREIAEEVLRDDAHFRVYSYKKRFCEQHKLRWHNSCYFCQYTSMHLYDKENNKIGILLKCERCPLRSCDASSLYGAACFGTKDRAHRAAEEIADILEGKI